MIVCNLCVCVCAWVINASGIGALGVMIVKCMVFNCSLAFEFGYTHTLVQMDPTGGAGPFVWISSDIGH